MFKILSVVKNLPKEITAEYKEIQIDEKDTMTKEEMLKIIELYDGLIAGDSIQYNHEIFSKAKNLKVISRFGVGVDNVNIADASKFNIKVTNAPAANAESVAEHTICLMIAASKNIAALDRKIKAKEWPRNEAHGFELANKTLGQVGFGNIGKLVSLKCKLAFNMDILVYDPFVPPYEMGNLVYGKKCELDYILENSDFISINLPANDATKNMFGMQEFKKMKKTAVLVNTGRGEVLVEDDLAAAVRNGEIFAAGLDVLKSEPVSKNSPLLKEDRIIITPHSASFTPEAFNKVLRTVLEDQMKIFRNEKPFFLINK